MDFQPKSVMQLVWQHSNIDGYVFIPHIINISTPNERFVNGAALHPCDAADTFADQMDWYWTPAVSRVTSRKASAYGPQRVVWVDCDDGYDDSALMSLEPSILWETSPGHRQAIWLMEEEISQEEYKSTGILGLLARVTKGDPSGVDISQLLRVPGTYHHKRDEYLGKILKYTNKSIAVVDLLKKVARILGLQEDTIVEMYRGDILGDRSKVLWRLSCLCANAGIDKVSAVTLLSHSAWNKWDGNIQNLVNDVDKAYAHAISCGSASPEGVAPQEVEETYTPIWDVSPLSVYTSTPMRPVQWLIPHIIPRGGCGVLAASPKIGKTRLALEILTGLSCNDNPMGILVDKHPNVGLLSLEDGEELVLNRISQCLYQSQVRSTHHWAGYIDLDLVWHPGSKINLFVGFNPADLSQIEDRRHLLDVIQNNSLDLLIIDTLSMCIGKADINNSTDMYSILSGVKYIAQKTNCAIMFIHHTRKKQGITRNESMQDMLLGSTAVYAWSDFVLHLYKDKDDIMHLQSQNKQEQNSFCLDTNMRIVTESALQM